MSLSVALLLVPMLYSPIVPAFLFVTNNRRPTLRCFASDLKPVMSEALITAPEVMYSPIVPVVVGDEQFAPDAAMPTGIGEPRDERGVDAPEVVYSPIVPKLGP